MREHFNKKLSDSISNSNNYKGNYGLAYEAISKKRVNYIESLKKAKSRFIEFYRLLGGIMNLTPCLSKQAKL